MYVECVARDFVGVVFHVLLDGAKGSHNHWDCCCLSPHIRSTSISKSLYLVIFPVFLTEVLVSRGIVFSTRRQVLSCLFFSTMSGLLAVMVLSVWMRACPTEWWRCSSLWQSWVHSHTIFSSPQCQTLCTSSSACVQLPCSSGGRIQF